MTVMDITQDIMDLNVISVIIQVYLNRERFGTHRHTDTHTYTHTQRFVQVDA